MPEKKVLYQFSARGHDVAQVILGQPLEPPARRRGRLLPLAPAAPDARPLARGRVRGADGQVGRLQRRPRHRRRLQPAQARPGPSCSRCRATSARSTRRPPAGPRRSPTIATCSGTAATTARSRVVLGGEASVATNGFWSALTIATTLKLPMLFYIEDNGYGISVPSQLQTPGGNIAANLASFANLLVRDGDGTDPPRPRACSARWSRTCGRARARRCSGSTVPRLSGHSGQDTQAYKSTELLAQEQASDPLPEAARPSCGAGCSPTPEHRGRSRRRSEADVQTGPRRRRWRGPSPMPSGVTRHALRGPRPDGKPELQRVAGSRRRDTVFPPSSETPTPEGARINLLTAIRRTLEHELKSNPKVLVFGEDVGPKGGVHAATLGPAGRPSATSGCSTPASPRRASSAARSGMALAGLMPVPEIQFRKYADPATEQLNNCGTIRWRTNNRWAAPIVVRMPGGYAPKCGDPWHSVCGEVLWAHATGWQVAMPSNAEDAVGLLRTRAPQQQPHDLLRAPRAAGRHLGPPALSRRRLRGAVRQGADHRRGRQAHRGDLGRDGGALRGGGEGERAVGRTCSTCAPCRRGTGTRCWPRSGRPAAA